MKILKILLQVIVFCFLKIKEFIFLFKKEKTKKCLIDIGCAILFIIIVFSLFLGISIGLGWGMSLIFENDILPESYNEWCLSAYIDIGLILFWLTLIFNLFIYYILIYPIKYIYKARYKIKKFILDNWKQAGEIINKN